MSLFILNIEIVSLFQHNHPNVCAAVQFHPIAELASRIDGRGTAIRWYNELRRAEKPSALAAVYQRMAQTVQFFAQMPIVTFTETAIHRYESLKKLKIKIKKTDPRIAAIALEQSVVVVTRNLRDSTRVPELQTEDWSK